MLQAIIVDNESGSRATLHQLIDECCSEVAVVDTADSVDKALEAIVNHTNLDLLFLDIEMDKQAGLHLLSQLRNKPFEVIFTAAREEHALKAIKYNPIDYLLKPLDSWELQRAVNKVREKKAFHQQMERLMNQLKQAPKKERQQIALATQEGLVFVNVADILRCRADGAYTTFYLKNGSKILTSKNLKEYEGLLSGFNFFRVHHSYLINMEEIKKYVRGEGGYVIMSDDYLIDVSKRRKDAFLTQIARI